MSTHSLEAFLMSTVYLVVTVTVNRPEIDVPVVVVIAIKVMDFNQRIGRENESTGITSAALMAE